VDTHKRKLEDESHRSVAQSKKTGGASVENKIQMVKNALVEILTENKLGMSLA
jgi:hypothetical protein